MPDTHEGLRRRTRDRRKAFGQNTEGTTPPTESESNRMQVNSQTHPEMLTGTNRARRVPFGSQPPDTVERFLLRYLANPAIRLLMIRVIAEKLGPQSHGFAVMLFDKSLALLIGPSDQAQFNLETIEVNAPALKMLVEYANEMGASYFDRCIPSPGTVDAFMRLFVDRNSP